MDKRVLVADDERPTLELLENGLNRHGFEVITACDGLEAKEKILQDKPEVIVLDLIMPNLDGWGVLQWLKNEVKLNIPVIILSAKGELDSMKRGYNLEADTYLVKPVDIDELLAGIRAVCSLREEQI
mgnify:CR=1 FL=1